MGCPRIEIDDTSSRAVARSEWMKPELRRLNAAGAETGSTAVTDIGVTYS